MQAIAVRTTQNVLIEYPVAGIFQRISAFTLDFLILLSYVFLVSYMLDSVAADQWVRILISFSPPFFYDLVCEITMNGQSLGKRAIRLKVVRLDGGNPTIANYLLRWLLRPLEIAPFGSIATISILFTHYGQRLGDLAAGTVVVRLISAQNVTSQEILLMMEEDYIPLFPQVRELSDKDIDLIKQTLEMYKTLGNRVPVMQVETKLKSMLGIESALSPPEFLLRVLKDYSHITSGNVK